MASNMLSPDYKPDDDEEFMNPMMQEFFRQRLVEWKNELLRESGQTLMNMQSTSSQEADIADRASLESERSLELRTRDRERKLIKKIEESIQDLEDNEYGYCEACGVEIGVKRLEARPTATLCIDCKILDEIKEKQTKGK